MCRRKFLSSSIRKAPDVVNMKIKRENILIFRKKILASQQLLWYYISAFRIAADLPVCAQTGLAGGDEPARGRN